MGSRVLALMCVISAGCGGGYLSGMPTPSIPDLTARPAVAEPVIDITVQPVTVVAASTGAGRSPISPGGDVGDDDVRFAESANPLEFRDLEVDTESGAREVHDRAPMGEPWQPEPPYDWAAVVNKIRRVYAGRLQRCFRPIAEGYAEPGKLSLAITVGEGGRVTAAQATGLTPDMASCARTHALEWRFPAPRDEDGEATEVSLTLALQVVP